MIRWLHISDLHLNDCNFSSARLRDELPSFLRNKRMKCDYVFCTGDIRSANVSPNSFTEDMADYMRNICHAVGVPIERLFIVPGNHDVNIFAEGREDAIKHIVPYDGYYKPDIGHIDTVDLEKLQSGKEDFVDFLSEFMIQIIWGCIKITIILISLLKHQILMCYMLIRHWSIPKVVKQLIY